MPPTEIMRKWVREIPGATGSVQLKSPGTDADPADAIANVFKDGKVSAAPVDSKDSKEKNDGLEKDIKDLDKELKEVGEALNDPEKFLIAKAKWKVPAYHEKFEKDTPESRFLADLESGTQKAKEYFDYITKAADYVEKFGDLTALQRLKDTAKGLKTLTKKLSDSLGKVGKAINTIEDVTEWFGAMGDFANASSEMDPRNRKSVERWVKSMKKLSDATAPFAEWAHSKAAVAAISGGSRAAAAFSATLAIVGSQLLVGLEALDAGLKVVSAYLDRYERIMKEIDRQAGHGPPKPPPPTQPHDDWKSREEQAGEAKFREMDELTNKIRQERDYKVRQVKEAKERALKEAQAAFQRAHKAAIDEFENKLFPKIYVGHRKTYSAAIRTALQKRDGNASKWWDCFSPVDNADRPGVGAGFDPKAGAYVYPIKMSISHDEALSEIANFKRVSPPYPQFKQLHETELKKRMAKVAPATPYPSE